jgi:hypothetical protein
MRRTFSPGEPVIYRKSKCSSRPGRRAVQIDPSPRGEEYAYCVDKYWVVLEQRDGVLVVATRRGKHHTLRPDDPNLRRPSFWERWFHSARFPQAPRQPAAV